MNKKSFDRSTWEKIKQKLLTIPDAGDPSISGAKSKLNTFKFEVVEKGPDGKPDSIAYVTGEDANNNGIVDTINIVAPKFEDIFKRMYEGKTTSQIDSIDKEILRPFLKEVANTILHEAKHLKDAPLKLDPTQPGGGFAPETAAQAAEHHSIDNKSAKRNLTMKKQQTLDILTKLASDLKGKDKNASREVNALIVKYAAVELDTTEFKMPETKEPKTFSHYGFEYIYNPNTKKFTISNAPSIELISKQITPVSNPKAYETLVKYMLDNNIVTPGDVPSLRLGDVQAPVAATERLGTSEVQMQQPKLTPEPEVSLQPGKSASWDLSNRNYYVEYNGSDFSLVLTNPPSDPLRPLVGEVIVYGPGTSYSNPNVVKNREQLANIVFEGESKLPQDLIIKSFAEKVRRMFSGIEAFADLKDDSLNKIASLKEQYAEVLTFEKRHPFGRNFKG